MIPDEKKEEVRQAADIVDVVSDHVKLRRSGSNFMGLCPFHNEKTPSFNVSPKLSIYKCFGCSAAGDVFDFVMKMDGVSFEEAVRSLAERYNVVLPENSSQQYDPRQHLKDGIYHALRFAGVFFHQVLAEYDEAQKARDYLEKRGYPWKVVRKYGIGYAPDRYDGLLTAAQSAGINMDYLSESGLVKARERSSGFYDTFRGRVMFPIFNPGGKVIAFGGRTLSESNKVPKYINSPQTPVYDKSEVLYGIHSAKNEIRKNGEVILVEGYTDVISMHQVGIGNVVSTSGTSLTNRQVSVMRRYGDVLTMIFDADLAGMKAAVRGIRIALEGAMHVKILSLPEGEDPDSFVRTSGLDGFIALKNKKTRNFLQFMADLARHEGRWDDPVDRKKVISEIIDAIAVIPDELSRMNYIQELSGISKIGDRTLVKELESVRARQESKDRMRAQRPGRQPYHPSNPPVQPPVIASGTERPHGDTVDNRPAPPLSQDAKIANQPEQIRQGRRPNYEKELLRLMLIFGEKLIAFIGTHCNEQHFEDPDLRTLFEDILSRYKDEKDISIEVYSRMPSPYPALMGEIALERHAVSSLGMKKRGIEHNKDAFPLKTARGSLKSLKIRYLERMREELLREYQKAKDDEKSDLQALIKRVSGERGRYQKESLDSLFPEDEPDQKKGSKKNHVNPFKEMLEKFGK